MNLFNKNSRPQTDFIKLNLFSDECIMTNSLISVIYRYETSLTQKAQIDIMTLDLIMRNVTNSPEISSLGMNVIAGISNYVMDMARAINHLV